MPTKPFCGERGLFCSGTNPAPSPPALIPSTKAGSNKKLFRMQSGTNLPQWLFQTVKVSVKLKGQQTQSEICSACLLLKNTHMASGQMARGYTPVPSFPKEELLLTPTESPTASTAFKSSCIFWAALKITLDFLNSLSTCIRKPWPLKCVFATEAKKIKQLKRILSSVNKTALKGLF